VEKLDKVIDTLETVKPKDLKAFDFEQKSPFYDYFVICTVNERQGNAAVNHLKNAFGADGIRSVEGKGGSWLLVDLNDIIVHLFSEEDRAYYDFDRRLIGIRQVR
jgi:ribosome-associated protein